MCLSSHVLQYEMSGGQSGGASHAELAPQKGFTRTVIGKESMSANMDRLNEKQVEYEEADSRRHAYWIITLSTLLARE